MQSKNPKKEKKDEKKNYCFFHSFIINGYVHNKSEQSVI